MCECAVREHDTAIHMGNGLKQGGYSLPCSSTSLSTLLLSVLSRRARTDCGGYADDMTLGFQHIADLPDALLPLECLKAASGLSSSRTQTLLVSTQTLDSETLHDALPAHWRFINKAIWLPQVLEFLGVGQLLEGRKIISDPCFLKKKLHEVKAHTHGPGPHVEEQGRDGVDGPLRCADAGEQGEQLAPREGVVGLLEVMQEKQLELAPLGLVVEGCVGLLDVLVHAPARHEGPLGRVEEVVEAGRDGEPDGVGHEPVVGVGDGDGPELVGREGVILGEEEEQRVVERALGPTGLGEVQARRRSMGQQVKQAAIDREGDAVGPDAAVAGDLDCRLHCVQRDLGHPDANALAVAGQVVVDVSMSQVRLGPDGLPRALQGPGHVWRVSDAVAAGVPDVCQCEVLL
jgi:hypothetical protein